MTATACDICGALPCVNPSFCRTCRQGDERRRQERQRHASPPARPEAPSTPQSTIDADTWARKFNPDGERARALKAINGLAVADQRD